MHKSILPITFLGGVENLRIVRMRTATPLPDRTVERQQVRTSVIGDKKCFSGLILSFHYNILECLAGEGGSVFVLIIFRMLGIGGCSGNRCCSEDAVGA